MSNHYLIVDDARAAYFDCEKFLLDAPDGYKHPLSEQPFDEWLRAANWGDDPPEQTNRYQLAVREGRALYEFLCIAGWQVRIVSLDSDDYADVAERYRCVGSTGTLLPPDDEGGTRGGSGPAREGTGGAS